MSRGDITDDQIPSIGTVAERKARRDLQILTDRARYAKQRAELEAKRKAARLKREADKKAAAAAAAAEEESGWEDVEGKPGVQRKLSNSGAFYRYRQVPKEVTPTTTATPTPTATTTPKTTPKTIISRRLTPPPVYSTPAPEETVPTPAPVPEKTVPYTAAQSARVTKKKRKKLPLAKALRLNLPVA
jgi:hypothetical protein